MPRIHRTRADADKNPELAHQLGVMRGTMANAAERNPLPPGFTAEPTDRSAFRIVHEASGRSHVVGLYAYGATRKAISALFPDGMSPTAGEGSRFEVRDEDGASLIHDKATGLAAEVPLYAFGAAMEAVKVIADGYMTDAMRLEASLEPRIELVGATLIRAPYPSNDDPAYRIVADDGEEIGFVHRRGNHWAVIDFDRFGKDDPDAPERIEYAERKSLRTAMAHVEAAAARRSAPVSPSP